jgi:hypothetical protein
MTETSVEQYVDQTAALMGLPLHPEHRPGVLDNLVRTQAIVKPLLEFEIPEDVEIAPVFTP